MLYRALTVVILAFWLLMMALLLRVEFAKDETELLPVPAEYVWKLMFLHDQPSDLVLYNQRQRIGSLHLLPSRLPNATDGTAGPVRLLSASGSAALSLPGAGNQNITLRASLELDAHNNAQRFGMNVSIHAAGQNAPAQSFVLDGRPAVAQWHYQLRRGEVVEQEASGTPVELLDALDLSWLGLDPKTVLQAAQQQMDAATVTARRGVLHTGGDDIEAYVVTARQAEALETTIYVSQLGQVLAVKTFTGYDLLDESLTP